MGGGASPYLLQQKRVGGQAQQFDNLIAAAAANGAEKVGASSSAAQAPGAAASKPDFRSMTPEQFRFEVKGMYDRGEIGADTFFSGVTLRTYSQDESSFGYMDGGKFDYASIFQDAKHFAASHAGQYDSKAETRNYDTNINMMARWAHVAEQRELYLPIGIAFREIRSSR